MTAAGAFSDGAAALGNATLESFLKRKSQDEASPPPSAKKSKKHHEPRFADAILPLQVRGKVLWFQNSQKCVTLALREDKAEAKSTDVDQGEVQGEGEGEDHAIEDLRWFLTQLDNDIVSMQPAEPD